MVPNMRYLVPPIILMACLGNPAEAKIPDMTCQETKKIYLATANFEPHELDDDTLYRFAKNKLYLSTPSKKEYLYNDVSEQEYGRWLSGHMTIIFKLGDHLKSGLIVHANAVEVSVSRIHCTKTK